MALFLQILFTVFIAEMGDKTQLMMIAMTAKFKVRDIIIGAGIAILVLNAMAVIIGGALSSLIPAYIIKIAAAAAFFYFAFSSLSAENEEEKDAKHSAVKSPILAVFGTFFLAELGDKTQLTAITFAANEGLSKAVLVWMACSIGLFAADVIGMLAGYLMKSKMPEGFLNKLAVIIFTIFGIVTAYEACTLLFAESATLPMIITVVVAIAFIAVCAFRIIGNRKTEKLN